MTPTIQHVMKKPKRVICIERDVASRKKEYRLIVRNSACPNEFLVVWGGISKDYVERCAKVVNMILGFPISGLCTFDKDTHDTLSCNQTDSVQSAIPKRYRKRTRK